MWVYVGRCVCVHVQHVCVYMQLHVCVHVRAHVCRCVCIHVYACMYVHVCGGVGAQVWSHVPWWVRVSVQGESAETIPGFSQHSLPPSQCTSVSLSLRLLETPHISTGGAVGGVVGACSPEAGSWPQSQRSPHRGRGRQSSPLTPQPLPLSFHLI